MRRPFLAFLMELPHRESDEIVREIFRQAGEYPVAQFALAVGRCTTPAGTVQPRGASLFPRSALPFPGGGLKRTLANTK